MPLINPWKREEHKTPANVAMPTSSAYSTPKPISSPIVKTTPTLSGMYNSSAVGAFTPPTPNKSVAILTGGGGSWGGTTQKTPVVAPSASSVAYTPPKINSSYVPPAKETSIPSASSEIKSIPLNVPTQMPAKPATKTFSQLANEMGYSVGASGNVANPDQKLYDAWNAQGGSATTGQGSWEDQLRAKYGIQSVIAPTFQQAPTYDEGADFRNREQQIYAKYNLLREQTKKDIENTKQAQISSLYSMGEVNPLSSGIGSVDAYSKQQLNEQMNAIGMMETAEMSGARAETQAKARENYEATITRQKEQFDYEQKAREENINSIKNAMATMATGKQLEQDEKDNAWTGISNLLSTFGTEAFEGVDEATQAQMEQASGMPKGSLSKGLKAIKQQMLTGSDEPIKMGNYLITKNASGGYDTVWAEPTSGLTEAPTLKEIDGVTKQWNPYTGQWEAPTDGGVAGGQESAKTSTARTNVSLVDEILNADPSKFNNLFSFGRLITGHLPGETQTIKNKVEQLKNLLTVDSREKLKGTGAISDYEARMLAASVSALDYNMNAEAAKQEIQKIKQAFQLGAIKSIGFTHDEIMDAINQGADLDGMYEQLINPHGTITPTFNQPLSRGEKGSPANISVAYQSNAKGGQCGTFAHRLVDFPPVGDSKEDKIKAVQKWGLPSEVWRTQPRAGDVLITDESRKYGHVAVVNAVLPDGTVRLTESNMVPPNAEKVSNTRIISLDSPKIYGAIRGGLKV